MYAAWPDTMDGFSGSCGRCVEVACVNKDFADSFGQWQQRSNACYDESRTVVVKIVDRCVPHALGPLHACSCMHRHAHACTCMPSLGMPSLALFELLQHAPAGIARLDSSSLMCGRGAGKTSRIYHMHASMHNLARACSCPCVHQNAYSNARWCCGDMK